MANLQKSKDKKYYIPLEITEGTIITKEFENAPRVWSKIGNKMVRSILVPATEEQYKAYMRPEWREDKRQQRLAESRRKREESLQNGTLDKSIKSWDTAVSYEQLSEMDFMFEESQTQLTLEELVEKKELLETLKGELAKLEEINRTILLLFSKGDSEAAIGAKVGLSQKGVNKRKQRLFQKLREQLKDFR